MDIHLKPETLHFGFAEKTGTDPVQYQKTLRTADGGEAEDVIIDPVPLKTGTANGVVNIDQLKNEIKTKNTESSSLGLDAVTPAQFAMEMIEGVELMRFMVKSGE